MDSRHLPVILGVAVLVFSVPTPGISSGRGDQKSDVKSGPKLLAPSANQRIPQNDPSTGCALLPLTSVRGGRVVGGAKYGHGFQIAFDWADVPGATRYRLVARRTDAGNPAVNRELKESTYTHVSCNTFVVDRNLRGWFWQVQAYVNRTWGAFSDPRPFEFLPCRLRDEQPCNAVP